MEKGTYNFNVNAWLSMCGEYRILQGRNCKTQTPFLMVWEGFLIFHFMHFGVFLAEFWQSFFVEKRSFQYQKWRFLVLLNSAFIKFSHFLTFLQLFYVIAKSIHFILKNSLFIDFFNRERISILHVSMFYDLWFFIFRPWQNLYSPRSKNDVEGFIFSTKNNYSVNLIFKFWAAFWQSFPS